MRLLVAAGADLQRADAQGLTPPVHAEQRTVVEILRKAGARRWGFLPVPAARVAAAAVSGPDLGSGAQVTKRFAATSMGRPSNRAINTLAPAPLPSAS